MQEPDIDQMLMQRALMLAEQGRNSVSPNPMVGCVLVRDGEIVGEGFHVQAGGPHAEIVALQAAGQRAQGATAYVTLEPCAHTGRTGPCADALIAAGVARVVVALADPNPLAQGGAARLQAAGIDVHVGIGAQEAAKQNEVFLHGLVAKRPFVTLKAAMSVDGRIAAADGTSQWLTAPATRELAHALRAEADAVVVGSGTVLADNPALTVRLRDYHGAQPLRVVLDGRARLTPDSQVFDDNAPTLLVAREDADAAAVAALRAANVDVALLPRSDEPHHLIAALLELLWQREVRSVLVEGGAEVLGSFLRASLWDRLVVHLAGLLLGEAGRAAMVGDGIATLVEAPRLRLQSAQPVDDDVVLTYRPAKEVS